MNNKILSAAVLVTGLALSVTQWKSAVAGAYANPVYSMYNANVVEKEKTKGCKLYKDSSTADLVLFDDGTWVLTGAVPATGTWAQTSEKDVWLSPSDITDFTSAVNTRATQACAEPKSVLTPTTLVKKMKLTLNSKGSGTFNMKLKGYDESGNTFTYSYTIKGSVQ